MGIPTTAMTRVTITKAVCHDGGLDELGLLLGESVEGVFVVRMGRMVGRDVRIEV